MALATVTAVLLATPHVGLTNPDYAEDYEWDPTQFHLWEHKSPEKTAPATIKLDGKKPNQLKLAVAHIAKPNTPAQKWCICGELSLAENVSIPLRSEPIEVSTSDAGFSIVSVEIPRLPDGHTAPWGFDGEVQWRIIPQDEADKDDFTGGESAGSTRLELYAIVDNIATAYNQGIPAELLRLFVLPATKKGMFDLLDWANWVVRMCHASTEDPIDSPPAVPKDERIHSYQYDIWHGGSQFTTWSATFDLNSWISKKDKASYINCYDQAGLVNCCLFLGFPYVLESSRGKKVASLTSEDYTVAIWSKGNYDDGKPKFGYIKELRLVGWGNTNDPFFGHNANHDMTKYHDNDLKRSSFSNHKWACIRRPGVPGSQDDRWAADACGYSKIVEINSYLGDAIDAISSAQAAKDKKEHFVGWGLGNVTEEEWLKSPKLATWPEIIGPVKDISPLPPRHYWQNHKLEEQHSHIQDELDLVANQDPSPIAVPVRELLDRVLNMAKDKTNNSDWDPKSVKPKSDRSVTYFDADLYVNNKSVLTVSVRVLDEWQPTSDAVVDEVLGYTSASWKVMHDTHGAQLYLSAGTDNVSSISEIIAFPNIVFVLEVAIENSHKPGISLETLELLRQQIFQTCNRYKDSSISEEGIPLEFPETMPTETKVGTPHRIYLKAEQFEHFDVRYDDKHLWVSQLAPEGGPGNWVFQLKAKLAGDENSSHNPQLSFYTADKTTYYPRTWTSDLAINREVDYPALPDPPTDVLESLKEKARSFE